MTVQRVLLITYFFDDTHRVGAKRARYWADNMERIDPSCVCSVITSEPPSGRFTACRVNVVPDDQRAPFSLIKDAGVTWGKALKRYFKQSGMVSAADVVIMTGSPFMHFSIARDIKQQSGARVFLDFRDPFANHPHFGRQRFKSIIKSFYEKRFVTDADRIITVNKTCAKLLHPAARSKTVIIENGYDDSTVDAVPAMTSDFSKLHLVYAGSFYPSHDRQRGDRDPAPLLEALRAGPLQGRVELHHVGPLSDLLPAPAADPACSIHGPKNYRDMIAIIKSADIGIIFTGGKDFETTTKVFDYIGCDKPILIITNGSKRAGELHETTMHLNHIHWVSNDAEEIRSFLDNYNRPSVGPVHADREHFSRKQGLLRLINLIKERS